jgi:hypothetical protein
VPFAYLEGQVKRADNGQVYQEYRVVKGTATGIHAATGKVLYRDWAGAAKQTDSYSASQWRVPDEQTAARLAEISTSISLLTADKKTIIETLRFPQGNLKEEVRKAIEEARKANGTGGGGSSAPSDSHEDGHERS